MSDEIALIDDLYSLPNEAQGIVRELVHYLKRTNSKKAEKSTHTIRRSSNTGLVSIDFGSPTRPEDVYAFLDEDEV